MPALEIIGAPQSNYVWTCRIAAGEKGVPYTLIPARPHTPEVDAIHPFGKIPVMRHGLVQLSESKAIATYIDRAFPGPALMPDDPAALAQAEQWVSLINTAIQPPLGQYMVAYYFPGTADGKPNQAVVETAANKLPALLDVLSKAVAADGHLAGGRFTIADMTLVPLLYYLAKLPESGVEMSKRPELTACLERHMKRPAVASTVPPPFPDLPPRG